MPLKRGTDTKDPLHSFKWPDALQTNNITNATNIELESFHDFQNEVTQFKFSKAEYGKLRRDVTGMIDDAVEQIRKTMKNPDDTTLIDNWKKELENSHENIASADHTVASLKKNIHLIDCYYEAAAKNENSKPESFREIFCAPQNFPIPFYQVARLSSIILNLTCADGSLFKEGSVKQICWAVLTVSFQGSHQKVMLNKYKLLKNAFVSLFIKSRIKGDTKHTAPFSATHLETLFDYVFPEDIGQCNGDQLNHANHLANHFFGLLRATEADCQLKWKFFSKKIVDGIEMVMVKGSIIKKVRAKSGNGLTDLNYAIPPPYANFCWKLRQEHRAQFKEKSEEEFGEVKVFLKALNGGKRSDKKTLGKNTLALIMFKTYNGNMLKSPKHQKNLISKGENLQELANGGGHKIRAT